MKDINLKYLHIRKRKMEHQIQKIISEFNIETEIKVTGVELTYVDFSFDTPQILSDIKTQIEL